MFDKKIIYFKNILFLKAIIYIAIYGLLIWSIPFFQNNFKESIEGIENSRDLVKNIKGKVLITRSKPDYIREAYQEYKRIKKLPNNFNCLRQERMSKMLTSTFRQTNKLSKIKAHIPSQSTSSNLNNRYWAHLRTANIKVSFANKDLYDYFTDLENINAAMPQNIKLKSFKVSKVEVMTPEIFKQLKRSGVPLLIKGDNIFQLSDIRLKK